MSPAPHRLDMFILYALMHDAESLEDIVKVVNEHPDMEFVLPAGQVYTREEALTGLSRLIRDGSVIVLVAAPDGSGEAIELAPGQFPSTGFASALFDISPRGSVRYMNWDD